MMVCVVLGYVPSGRDGFRSLILASELGGELRCVGRIARGFDENARTQLEKLLRSRLAERAFLAEARANFSRTRVNRFAKVRVALGDPKVPKSPTRV